MELYQGDCMEVLRQLPDGMADMVLTDPPYSSGGLHTSTRQQATGKKYGGKEHNGMMRFADFEGDNMDMRSFTAFMRDVLFTARQKTRESGLCAVFIDFRNLPAITDAVQMAGWVWRGIAIWDKMSSRPQMGRYRNQCEYIVWGSNGPLPFDRNIKPLPGVYRYPNVSSQKRQHQTEKPVELMRDLLEIVHPGAMVLDPFMGSGTTGVACAETGRHFVGIELSQTYYQTAQRRIAEAVQLQE